MSRAPTTLPTTVTDALWVEELVVTYANGTRALWPTSLNLRAGAMTVLLGASGAGKSTLLRCLNGLVMPTSGRVVSRELGPLAGRSNWRRHRARTGMVFQQHHLIGRQTVLANVLMGLLGSRHSLGAVWPWSRGDKVRALAAIERVGLLDRALHRADELSGGQQQRVGVARALVQQPHLLLADEPVASLDPATSVRLLSLLRDICSSDGLTVVVSLHQVEFARRFADRIVGLRQGRVVLDGAPSDLSEERLASLYEPVSPSGEIDVSASTSHGLANASMPSSTDSTTLNGVLA